MSWTVFPVLFVFIFVAYNVLRWLQRRSQYVNVPSLADGQWHPVAANYNWAASGENSWKREFYRLKEDPQATSMSLAQTLMKRTMEDVRQLAEMQEQKQTLQQLVKSGSIGEEVLQRFLIAEQQLNQECQTVVQEAESLKPAWGNQIFQQASQLLQAEMRRQEENERKQFEEEQRLQQRWDENRGKEELKIREEEARRLAEELIREEEEEKKKRKKK